MSRKNDIFNILSKIDVGDISAYDSIEKEFSPFMAMKWMASCKDPQRILATNQLLNLCVFNLHREKKLLYFLACCISDGERKRYNWIKRYKNVDTTKANLISEFFSITEKEAKTGLWKYATEDYLEMAQELGYNNDEIKKIKKKIS